MSRAPIDIAPDQMTHTVSVAPRLSRWHNRLVALPVFLAGSTVLGLAGWLTPNSAGLGTHRQLGLPPCQFEQVTGIPCATCGCTTSFAHAAHGSLLDAFITQPFGALLAVMTAMAVLISGYALVTNMQIFPIVRFMTRGKVVAIMVGYMLIAWGYCIARHAG